MFNQQMLELLGNETLVSLYMTLFSTILAYILGVPTGILLAVTAEDGIKPRPAFNQALGVVVNLLRSVPFLILIVCVLGLTRFLVGTTIGPKAMIPPLVIAAAPFVGRLVEGSLKEIDHGVIEAAQSMGATNWQIITRVLLPESLPSLGGGGLGAVAINYGYYRYQADVMWMAVVILVLIVQIFQAAGNKLTIVSDKRRR